MPVLYHVCLLIILTYSEYLPAEYLRVPTLNTYLRVPTWNSYLCLPEILTVPTRPKYLRVQIEIPTYAYKNLENLRGPTLKLTLKTYDLIWN